MFSRRFTRLMVSQMRVAVSRASLSVSDGVAVEVGLRIAEGAVAQRQGSARCTRSCRSAGSASMIDREVEEVGGVGNAAAIARRAAGLQHVEAFDDEDVGLVDDHVLVLQHVIGEMRIERRRDVALARLDVGQEAQDGGQVIAFRESPCGSSGPSRSRMALGRRKPSVVTRSTFGLAAASAPEAAAGCAPWCSCPPPRCRPCR